MLRILVVEDDDGRVAWLRERLPEDVHLVVASSAGRAIGLLRLDRGHVYAGVMLDHDLQGHVATEADKQLSGTEVLNTLMQTVSLDVPVLVHSMNPVDAPRMAKRLEQAGFYVERIPFAVLTPERFAAWLTSVREIWEMLGEEN